MELESGSGPAVGTTDTVRVEWTMMLHNPPLHFIPEKMSKTFRIGDKTLPLGLSVGICGMAPGGRRTILVPDKYNTVEREDIPRGSVLSYDVLLLKTE